MSMDNYELLKTGYLDWAEREVDFTPFETTYYGQKCYIQPETVFKHHFTNEPMIYIRMETVGGLGHGVAELKVVTLDQLDNMRDQSLVEEDDWDD